MNLPANLTIKGEALPFVSFSLKSFKRIIVFCFLFQSCQNPQKNQTFYHDDTYMFQISENHIQSSDLSLSNLIDSISYIPLETNINCLISQINQIYITENHIFIRDSKRVLSFSKDGSFNIGIGKLGKGPGEYITTCKFDIDYINKRVYVYAIFQNKIKVFDFKGRHLENISFPYSIDDFFFFENQLLLTTGSFTKPRNTYVFDLITKKIVDSLIYIRTVGIDACNKKLYLSRTDSVQNIDTLYSYHNKSSKSILYLNQQKKRNKDFFIPQLIFDINTKTYIMGNWQRAPYSYEKSWIHITKSGRKIPYMSVNRTPRNPGLYDTKKNEFCFIYEICKLNGIFNDIDSGLPFWPRSDHVEGVLPQIFPQNCIVSFYSAEELLEWSKNTDFSVINAEDSNNFLRLKQLIKNIGIENNPIIVIAYLKK